jgi:hypothetical protein
MKPYMFRTVPLSIIRSYSLYTQQWYMSYRFVDSFSAYFITPYCRDDFVQFFFGVSILICFLCLFGIDEFYVHVTVHRTNFLIIKPTRCTNFSNLFWKWNSTCFGQFLCPSSGVIHCTHSNGICHTGFRQLSSRIRRGGLAKIFEAVS